MPSAIDIVMCTTRPSTTAPPLNLASSGAPRHTVLAIRFTGVQNPAPVSHSTIIDHIAMTMPPPAPARAPRLSTCVFIAASPTAGSSDVRETRRVHRRQAAVSVR
jgi:hypothetical protein